MNLSEPVHHELSPASPAMLSEEHCLAGRLLLAMPGMGDPRFSRAVIVMCAHDEGGALGIGIGQIDQQLRFHALLRNVGIDPGQAPDCAIHSGGPVSTERGFVLHSTDWSDAETAHVGDGLALSASLDVLRAIAAGEGPTRWLFALGYAGWGAGQLEDELRGHGWSAGDPTQDLLFATPAEWRWTAAWKAQGIDPALLASTTGRA
jgi:putative transcriptional regulator